MIVDIQVSCDMAGFCGSSDFMVSSLRRSGIVFKQNLARQFVQRFAVSGRQSCPQVSPIMQMFAFLKRLHSAFALLRRDKPGNLRASMSCDLTIRGDETYSRSTPRAALEAFINQLPGVKRNGKSGFAFDARPKRWMEIDLEVVNEEGDHIEGDEQASRDVNCIRLHIPYKFLGDDIEHDYLPTAFAIADHVGWTLYDDQDDEPILKVESEEAATNAPAAFDRKYFIGDWLAFPYSFSSARMNYAIREDGRFEVLMLDDVNAFCASARGTWDLAGDAIQWTYQACKGFPKPRRPELNKILRFDEKRFLIHEKTGDETEFWRAIPARTVSATFTLAGLRPFLERLIQPIDGGFATREIDSLMKTAGALGSVKSQQRVFKIMFQDVVSPLTIQLSIGENKTFETTFNAHVALAEKIAGMLKTV